MKKIDKNVQFRSRNKNLNIALWDLDVTECDGNECEDNDFLQDCTRHHRMHNHVYNEIAIVTRGESHVVSLTDGISLKAPYLVVYPAGVPHVQINNYENGYTRYLVSYFDDFYDKCGLDDEHKNLVVGDNRVYAIKLDGHETEILVNMCKLLMAFREGDEDMLEQTVSMLIQRIARLKDHENLLRESEVTNYGKHYFGQLLKYIADHSGEKLSLGVLASRFYVSRTKLARDFGTVVGMSVGDYIQKVRVDKAKVKLVSGMSVADVAFECGFASTSYFIQTFKRITGKTPMQFIDYANRVQYGRGLTFNGINLWHSSLDKPQEVEL